MVSENRMKTGPSLCSGLSYPSNSDQVNTIFLQEAHILNLPGQIPRWKETETIDGMTGRGEREEIGAAHAGMIESVIEFVGTQ